MENHLMYLDESGVANLGDQKHKYFFITSVTVERSIDREVSAYFSFIKRRHGLDCKNTLHAYDVFENKGHENYITENKICKKIANSIGEFVENAPFDIRVYYIDKDKLRKKMGVPEGYQFKGAQKHKEDKELPYEIIARKHFFEFAKYLKKKRAIGSVIAESRRGADKILLTSYLDAQDKNIFSKDKQMFKNATLAKEHIHSICFAGKGSLKGGLEFADIISYCAYNDIAGNFPEQRNDSRGIKVMWGQIKKQIYKSAPQEITPAMMKKLANDRINESAKRVKQRLSEFSDLVNPTRR